MKKWLLLLLLLLPMRVFGISAKSYIVMDQDSKRVLEGSNINEPMLIASTTKIMTAIIAMEYADVNKEVTVDEAVLKSYGSGIYIEIGEKISLKNLLYGLMLRSGNDAAMMIATFVAGDMENFADLMNDKAKSLGMNNTHFINSSGLEDGDEGNMSTSYDMALLMCYAMDNELFREIVSTENITVKTNYKTYVWHNKNKLLDMYKYTTGGKTGFTEKARRTLVTSASKDGKNLVVVTLNDGNDFVDHKNLYEENFKKYDKELILEKNELVENDNYYKHSLYISNDVYILKKNSEEVKIEYDINKLDKVLDGDVVGKAKVLVNGKLGSSVDIKIAINEQQKEKKVSFFKKLWDFLIFWK